MKKIPILFTCLMGWGTSLYAQPMEQPSANYIKGLNSLVNGSPETSQMMKYVDFPVSLVTGTPQIDLPVYTLAGKGISLPVSLSYHAGGGVKVSDMASNVGLGWLLQTGGEVSREIRGIADETASIGFINKAKPLSYYMSIRPLYDDDPNAAAHFEEWSAAAKGQMDLEPDLFYFNFGGYSGKFMYDEIKKEFVNLNTSDRKLDIKFQVPGSSSGGFTITTDNGTRYIFNNAEKSSSQTLPMGMPGSSSSSPEQTTSWKLTRIINPDATDTIELLYEYNSGKYASLGSSTTYQPLTGSSGRSPVMNVYTNNSITGLTRLTAIVSRTDSLSIVYDGVVRRDYELQRAISRVIVSTRGGGIKKILRLHTSYFQRSASVGQNAAGTMSLESLRLDSLSEYGSTENNSNPLRHRFIYNSTQMPARMSFAQDMWGYANNNLFDQHMAPGMYIQQGGSPTYLPGADRTPDPNRMKAGILERIDLPTGGNIQFEYEPNTVSNSSLVTVGNTITSGAFISVFKGANQTFSSEYRDSFIVDEAPDPAINGDLGGVMANITLGRVKPGAFWGAPMDYGYVGYRIDRAPIPAPDPAHPFNGFSAQGPEYIGNVHLPNGKYYLVATNVGIMNDAAILGNVRNLYFGISFKIKDTTAPPSQYTAGGLRIKTISATDNYGGTPKVRSFIYDDENGSWGRQIGPDFHSYVETRISNGYRFFVRMGNNAMPGQGGQGNSVYYTKVAEVLKDGNKEFRTLHNFLKVEPNYVNFYPFVPGTDNEYARGKEILTEWTAPNGSTLETKRRTASVFDYSQPSTFTNPAMKIDGIKTVVDDYSESGSGFPMFTITPYSNNLSYVYLTSDSTYDYNPDNGIPNLSWNSYEYGSYNKLPLSITSQNSKGELVVQKNAYAADVAEPALAPDATLAGQLIAANRVSDVLASKTYVDDKLVNTQYTHSHFSGAQLLIDSMRIAEYGNPLRKVVAIPSYDPQANPLSVVTPGNRFRRYIWRKERNLALATCTMPQNSAFVFTSFEYPGEYSTIQEASRTAASAFSGSYAYNLNGSLIFQGFNSAGTIEVFAWLSQGSFTANGVAAVSTGRTKGGWTLYRAEIPNYATVTIGGLCTMDQLAIVPAGNSFDANIFDSQDRITAKVNSNMQTVFYEYDDYGRLTIARDEAGNILKTNDYQYQVNQ